MYVLLHILGLTECKPQNNYRQHKAFILVSNLLISSVLLATFVSHESIISFPKLEMLIKQSLTKLKSDSSDQILQSTAKPVNVKRRNKNVKFLCSFTFLYREHLDLVALPPLGLYTGNKGGQDVEHNSHLILSSVKFQTAQIIIPKSRDANISRREDS